MHACQAHALTRVLVESPASIFLLKADAKSPNHALLMQSQQATRQHHDVICPQAGHATEPTEFMMPCHVNVCFPVQMMNLFRWWDMRP